jgi:hypothetical protein
VLEIVCPVCAQVNDLVAIRRHADEFCAVCDYPLFWAPTAVPRPIDDPTVSLGRLPGVSGRGQLPSRECWECHELNPLWEVVCIRCGRELELPEPPAPPDVIEAQPAQPESAAAQPLHDPPANSMWNPLSAGLAGLSAVLVVIVALIALL